MSLTYLANQTMRDAIAAKVFDPSLVPFRNPLVRRACRVVLGWAARGVDPQNPHTYELGVHPRTERWQESTFAPLAHPDVTRHWVVEVARIVVPKGDVGQLRSIEQVVYDIDGNYYPTSSDYWGSPYSVLSEVDDLRWWFQLESFEGTQPPRFNATAVAPLTRAILPGYPYPELATIRGTWYAAQNSRTEVKMIIPGQKMLRMYMYSPPQTIYRWVAGGRLRATTQTTYCREAAYNARIN